MSQSLEPLLYRFFQGGLDFHLHNLTARTLFGRYLAQQMLWNQINVLESLSVLTSRTEQGAMILLFD